MLQSVLCALLEHGPMTAAFEMMGSKEYVRRKATKTKEWYYG